MLNQACDDRFTLSDRLPPFTAVAIYACNLHNSTILHANIYTTSWPI